jgi:hypothetical protein
LANEAQQRRVRSGTVPRRSKRSTKLWVRVESRSTMPVEKLGSSSTE